MKTYNFDLDVLVHDPDALFDAALASSVDNGIPRDEAFFGLKPDGVIDVSACLVQLLDPGSLPGCNILGSTSCCIHSPHPPGE